MSTNNAENVSFKILTMGRDEVDNRRPSNLRPLTLPALHAWIESKQIDSRVKEKLKKMASAYPQQALPSWVQNYNRHLAKAQKELKKTLDDEVQTAPIVELGDEERETNEEENRIPTNDEFDFGWENPGKDQG